MTKVVWTAEMGDSRHVLKEAGCFLDGDVFHMSVLSNLDSVRGLSVV